MKEEFKFKNTRNLATGTFHGTWTGSIVRVGSLIEITVDRVPRGINVPVTVIVTKEEVKVYTG